MIYAENILLCIAVPLLISLLFIRGEIRGFVGAFLLGMGVCLAAAYISGFLDVLSGMGENDSAIFLSPVIEETLKVLMVLFFMVLISPEDRTLVMLAVAIGAGFATFENCCQLLIGGTESLGYVLVRGLAVGVMHIVSLLALSLWLIASKRLKVFSFPAVAGGLAVAATFHALYNLLVSEPGPSAVVGYLMPMSVALIIHFLYRKLVFRNKK